MTKQIALLLVVSLTLIACANSAMNVESNSMRVTAKGFAEEDRQRIEGHIEANLESFFYRYNIPYKTFTATAKSVDGEILLTDIRLDGRQVADVTGSDVSEVAKRAAIELR